MSISPISNLIPNMNIPSIEQTKAPEASFTQWLGAQVSQTNQQLNEADHALVQLASGQSTNLHQTMLSLEEAKLSFHYLEQIRNRIMSAYQELLREQI